MALLRACFVLAGCCAIAAQETNRLATMHAPVGESEQLPPEARQGAALRSTTINVKVVLEGGDPLTVAPMVVESKADQGVCHVANAFRNGGIRLDVPNVRDESSGASCFLSKVMLPGYRSFSGVVRDGQTIALQRLGEHEGSTVSITSLSAPDKARKACEKGVTAARKHKWAEAQKRFEEAIAIYPVYATAWSELGAVYEQLGQEDQAAAAFGKSIAADPKYIRPLVQLAGLAGKQRKWTEEEQAAARALRLHPVEFPAAYFYFSEACFRLGRLQDAEISARAGLQVDQHREFVRTHLLLGEVLAQKGEAGAAIGELREYVRLAPHAEDAEAAQRQIASLQSERK